MKTRAYLLAPLLFGAACLLAGVNAVYPVGQAQQAVLLRLGRPAAAVNDGPSPTAAGLHLKWPLVDQVAIFDRRVLEVGTSSTEAAGGSPTALQADLRYRIRDPLRFYRALGDDRPGSAKSWRSVSRTVLTAPLAAAVSKTRQTRGPASAASCWPTCARRRRV